MFRKAPSRGWTCARCLRKKSQIRQSHQYSVSTSSEVATNSKFSKVHPLVNHAAPGTKQDDIILQKVFDSPEFWKEYSQSSISGPNRGLFQNQYLTDPQGFEKFATSGLHKAQKLVDKVLAASSIEQYLNVVKDLDRLSDLLCRVIDLSDFVRATHPDPKIQDAATQAYARLYEYMNVLNTTTGLAKQLNIAIDHASNLGAWDEEESTVANILKKDFEKSAIDLPQGEREKFVSLSQEISEIGQEFVDRMAPKERSLSFTNSKLKGLDPLLARRLTKWGTINLPSIGPAASAALQTVHDEEVRREIFISTRSSAKENVERLHKLLRLRAELAKLSKFRTYAHMTLADKMAKSPESVYTFLKALSKNNESLVSSELVQLVVAKAQATTRSDISFQPWDKDYYIHQLISAARSKLRKKGPLSSYFSLGRVMQGLSKLFSRLYGIRFVPREPLPGETWNSDVRRLDVISETDGHVAVLYCDLFSRPGKSPNPAHFTLRCSRLIRDSEIKEAAVSGTLQFESAVIAANDGMAVATTPRGIMQLPTIALICDFIPNTSDRPSLLSFSELTTLFHEMGHAIHSILGRTSFQNVSGTRCATDFAELPSVLMEHFAADPNVLGLFAEHYETGGKLDVSIVEEKLKLNSRFEGCETENQILLALLDQEFHSSLPMDAKFDSSKIYLDVQRRYGVLPPDPEGTSWQGFFGHLFGYGSMYYSYLFDRAVAKKIWNSVFDGGASSVERPSGENFKQKVLQWGGSRDPWQCLSEVLNDETLLDGGEKAMNLVGSWGIHGLR